jgi:DNA-binding NtrC family response regulator
LQFQSKPEKSPPTIQAKTGETLYQAVEALERKMIDEALAQADGNKHKAAELLGLSRQGLFKMLKRLGISSA